MQGVRFSLLHRTRAHGGAGEDYRRGVDLGAVSRHIVTFPIVATTSAPCALKDTIAGSTLEMVSAATTTAPRSPT